MKLRYYFLAIILLSLFSAGACSDTPKGDKVLLQSDFPPPPVAEVRPQTFTEFGNTRTDDYFYMKNLYDAAVEKYLKAENAYTDKVMAATQDLQNTIFEEIRGKMKESDESYPVFDAGYYYYSRTEAGQSYGVSCRRKGSMDAPEEIIFDLEAMAKGKDVFQFESAVVSPDNRKVAYLYNTTGSFADFILKIRDIASGKDIGFTMRGVSSVAWANDSKTLFYTVADQSFRPSRVYRRALGEPKGELVYEETNERFTTGVSGEKTERYIFISSGSSTTSDMRYISADRPTDKFEVLLPRRQDVQYSFIPYKDKFLISYKDKENYNGKLYEAPAKGYENPERWKELVPHSSEMMFEGVDIYDKFLVYQFRRNGLSELHIQPASGGEVRTIQFSEPVYKIESDGNPEMDAVTFRYSYMSLNRPEVLFEYNMETGATTELKRQEIPSGFNPGDYAVERLWATAPDGVKVPMSVVYRKDMKRNDGSNPALLYAYGSYGMSSDVFFPLPFFSLIDRGFVFAIAHVRGGGDMGEKWYEDGKMLKKMNTFTDFIACSESLIRSKYTSPGKLTAVGGSAGGMLMGGVANMRPDLYRAIIAQVPFMDVMNTMLDASSPLTVGEYEEWGNPKEEVYYRYMLGYSPYDNIKAQNYPNMLVTGGINDSQVLFHEPAKYVAKLRKMKTDDNLLLLRMNMKSGHGGATGRYDGIRDTALEHAFLLNSVGIFK